MLDPFLNHFTSNYGLGRVIREGFDPPTEEDVPDGDVSVEVEHEHPPFVVEEPFGDDAFGGKGVGLVGAVVEGN